MLKKKFKIIVLIVLVILFFMTPFVNAEDNETSGEAVTTSTEEQPTIEETESRK